MDQEFRDDRHRGRWVIVLGVILAVVAGVAAFSLINQAQQQAGQAQASKVPAVVAVVPIAVREPIKPTDLEVRQIPLDPTNANGVLTDPAEAIGRIPAVPILQGQIVTQNMLASTIEGGRFSILLPDETISPDSEEWRAVSVTVPGDLAVGGLLQPGQTVDLFVTTVVSVPLDIVEEGEFYTDRSTKLVYQELVLLAREGDAYVIRTSAPVAEEILHLQASGGTTFSLALRPGEDRRVVDTTRLGTTTNRIIEKYGLPLPEAILGGALAGAPGPQASAPTPTEAPPDPSPSVSPAP